MSLTQHSSIHRDLLFSHLKISTHQSDSVNAGSTEVAVTEAHKQRIGDGFINYWLLMLKGAHRKREGHRSFLVQTMVREIKNEKGWRCMHKELQGRWGKSVWRGMTLRSGKRLFRNSTVCQPSPHSQYSNWGMIHTHPFLPNHTFDCAVVERAMLQLSIRGHTGQDNVHITCLGFQGNYTEHIENLNESVHSFGASGYTYSTM